ncbi:MAG TPA: hypothetical protein VME46_21020 [Acidimicrobiales bacterium]|nr:hypothetical protein [Acidimicrobiales bacterium]
MNAPTYSASPTITPSRPSLTRPPSAQRSSGAAHPATGDHRTGCRRTHPAQQVEVRAAEHAVPEYVGHNVASTSVGVELGQHVEQLAALSGPTAGGHRGTADVEPDSDLLSVPYDRRPHPVVPPKGGGPDVHPGAAGCERSFERVIVGYPA